MTNYICLNILFVLIFYISISKCEVNYFNPTAISLSNGNLFIIHQTGIDICDNNLNYISTSLTFSDEKQITTDNLSKVVISKFDDGYIICIINGYFYIFNSEGGFIYEGANINRNRNPEHYTLVPEKVSSEDIYYYIAFIYGEFICLYYYDYNLECGCVDLYASNEYFDDNSLKNSGISCHIMNHNTKGNVFACFYITTENNQDYFRIRFFTRNGGLLEEYSYFTYKTFECSNVNYFKTNINSDNSKVFICFILTTGDNYCLYYDINEDSFSSNYSCNENICKNKYYGLQVNFFENNNNEFVFSCSGNNGNITLCNFDNNFNYNKKIIQFKECVDIEGYSNIYLNEEQEYYILSNQVCSGLVNPIPDVDTTIDSTIIEEEIEEKNEEEEEIEEEIEEKPFDEEKEESEEVKEEEKGLECELEKCKTCDKKSISQQLCIECNNLKGYYPLKINSLESSEVSKNYIDCVNNKTKPSRFYFNAENKDYEQCYERCASCEYGGNDNNNNCTSCDTGFIFNQDLINITNCVVKCPYYHYNYYGAYRCSSTFLCPQDYNLLIEEKNKCTNNCSNDDIFKYQYNGECLKNCPANTNSENSDYFCKDSNTDICSLSKKEIIISKGNITDNELGLIAKSYTNEYSYTDNHVSSFNNDNYIITFYKNKECISNLSLETSEIDFGECYEKVKNNYSIDDNLVLAVVSQKSNITKYPKLVNFSMYK